MENFTSSNDCDVKWQEMMDFVQENRISKPIESQKLLKTAKNPISTVVSTHSDGTVAHFVKFVSSKIYPRLSRQCQLPYTSAPHMQYMKI